jgi:DNA-3-methyladenine glycosylase
MLRLEREFFARDALEVAPELLNKVLVAGDCAGRIVEVEAYRSDEPAAHTFRGRTPRNAVMFGPAGHLYVYFSYGMHHCANVVTGDEDQGQAVLLRAVVPVAGVELMRARRPAGIAEGRLADGPGKLCQALAIDLSHSGQDLCGTPEGSAPLWLGDDGVAPPTEPLVTPRVGITKAVDLPWRFLVPGVPVSGVVRPARPARGTRRAPAPAPRRPATS